MKTLMFTLFSLLCSHAAMADTTDRFQTQNADSFGLLFLLTVGIVCLVIARRRTA